MIPDRQSEDSSWENQQQGGSTRVQQDSPTVATIWTHNGFGESS